MSEEMWDELPKSDAATGCIFGTLLGLAFGGLFLFIAYSSWQAYWQLGTTGKIFFFGAFVFSITFLISQIYLHDQESDNHVHHRGEEE